MCGRESRNRTYTNKLWLDVQRIVVRFPAKKKVLSKASKPALKPTKLPCQRVPWALPRAQGDRGMIFTIHLHLVSRFTTNGATPPRNALSSLGKPLSSDGFYVITVTFIVAARD